MDSDRRPFQRSLAIEILVVASAGLALFLVVIASLFVLITTETVRVVPPPIVLDNTAVQVVNQGSGPASYVAFFLVRDPRVLETPAGH